MQHQIDAPTRVTPAQRPLFLLFSLLVGLIGILALLIATRWGIGTTPDSVGYVKAARNILQGRSAGGIADATVTQWPPLYPLVLSVSGLFGVSPLSGARFVHLLLYSANVMLVGYLLFRVSHRLWIAAFGLVLLASSGVMLSIHAHAWSEPLFLFLAFLGLVVLARFLEKGGALKLLGASLLVGLACLTRYVGVTLIGAAALGILIFWRSPLRQRMVSAFGFCVLSAAPLVLWIAPNLLATGSTAGREIAFHPVNRDHFWHAAYTFSSWLRIADMTPGFVWISMWSAILVGAIGIIWLRRRRQQNVAAESRPVPQLLTLLVLFVVNYGLFLLFSISFLDANTPLDDRILSPVFVSGLILAVFLAGEVIRLADDKYRVAASALVGVSLFLLATAYLAHGVSWVSASRSQGLGYSSPRWQQSPLVAEAQLLPVGTVIYSNAPEVIELLAARPATALPRRVEAMTQTENTDYDTEVSVLEETVQSGEGVIVFFTVLDRPVMTIEELRQRISLEPIVQVTDGAIYRADR